MENLLHIALEAHNDNTNHHRTYVVALSRDLFDAWVVTIRYGRTGSLGQQRRQPVDSLEQARALVLQHLKRRLSARRRIGCDYRVVEFCGGAEFDPAEWLPEEFQAFSGDARKR
ncbi:MAG: WGR domain-containing protein [bacterium]|nr:WGR domain-containing protein [bacterium]